MALDKVRDEINKSAADAAKEIEMSADAEVKKILADADKEISEINKREEKRLSESKARLQRQEISSAELESKKIVLAKKNEILARTFKETLEQLESAPADKKLEQYKMMIEASKTVIPSPKVYIGPSDKFTASDLGVSSVSVDDRIKAGIILENDDGTVQVDMQYKTILQTIWDRETKNLTEILFG